MADDMMRNPAFDLWHDEATFSSPRDGVVRIRGRKVRVTPVFYAYWRFAAERQRIFYRRLRGTSTHRFTEDPVLARYKFTNAYRASDRVSQYLIRNVIYREDLPNDAANLFYRILLFKLFNKIETWQYLEEVIGQLIWEEFDFFKFDKALTDRMTSGGRIYSAAYMMPSARSAFGYELKHQNHLRLIEYFMAHQYPTRLKGCSSMTQTFELLRSAPSIGPFLAYQFAIDLNYSNLTNFSESDSVVAGPGSLDGIDKCFENAREHSPADVIQYMYEHQDRHFSEQKLDFLTLWGRPLQLIDCQNLFCEISKYARVAFPEFVGTAGRTRIKQKFSEGAPLPAPWYPPDWGLNAKIQIETLAKRGP